MGTQKQLGRRQCMGEWSLEHLLAVVSRPPHEALLLPPAWELNSVGCYLFAHQLDSREEPNLPNKTHFWN